MQGFQSEKVVTANHHDRELWEPHIVYILLAISKGYGWLMHEPRYILCL
jgi:hypothetical protein